MLVAELVSNRHFCLADRPIDPPGSGEIQVRVGAVGVCGSDVHSYSEGAIGDTPCQYPMVLGHEPAGTVVATGAGVTGWAPGDRAALEPAVYCYHCEYCRAGRHNICANLRFLSNPGIPGFFREFVNLPAENLLPIPAGLSLELASLAEPLAVAMHSLQFAALSIGETVAVFGAGPIGLLTIASLKVAGAGRIWAIEPVAHRREFARHMGAHETIDPNQADCVRELLAATGGRGVDCAIDCATKPAPGHRRPVGGPPELRVDAEEGTTNWAIRAARNGGRVLITGIHSAAYVPLDVSHMRRKELAIFNVRRSNHELEAARDLLVERAAWFAPLITHRRPLAQIAEAFALVENYADGVGKLIIE
jgi:L-iditol 2-dehydrogenase